MTDSEILNMLIQKAYTDRKILDYLEQSHNLQWRKVIQKILKKHFESEEK